MRAPSYCLAPVPQSSAGGCIQHAPYSYAAAPTVPVSSSKEAFAESLGLSIPKAEAKKVLNEGVPLPCSLSPHREDFYAELASLSSKDSKATLRNPMPSLSAAGTSFTICCNSCDAPIPNAHYHCSKCDDGDFDLCETCYNNSIRCNGDDHWLVKRGVKDGKVTSSSTETIAPRKSIASFFDIKNDSPPTATKEIPGAFTQEIKEAFQQPLDLSRTCNSCVTRKYCTGGHVRSMFDSEQNMMNPISSHAPSATIMICVLPAISITATVIIQAMPSCLPRSRPLSIHWLASFCLLVVMPAMRPSVMDVTRFASRLLRNAAC